MPNNRQGPIAAVGGFRRYRLTHVAELRPYVPDEDLANVRVNQIARANGSPKAGDMVARNPERHEEQWLVEAQYFADHFEPLH